MFSVILSIVTLMGTEPLAKADELYLGVLAGGNTSSETNSSSTATLGATVGALVAPNFGVAFFGSRYGQNEQDSLLGLSVGTSTTTTILTGQGNLFLGGLHAGGELGTAITSWSGNVGSLRSSGSNSTFVLGPQAGYDFRIALISIGVEAHYLISTAKDGVNNLQALAALKFWL